MSRDFLPALSAFKDNKKRILEAIPSPVRDIVVETKSWKKEPLFFGNRRNQTSDTHRRRLCILPDVPHTETKRGTGEQACGIFRKDMPKIPPGGTENYVCRQPGNELPG